MPEKHPRGFSQRLKFFTAEAGLTVPQLARAVGCKPEAIYNWHAGGGITFRNLQRVADALGINARLLLDGPELPAAEEQDPAAE